MIKPTEKLSCTYLSSYLFCQTTVNFPEIHYPFFYSHWAPQPLFSDHIGLPQQQLWGNFLKISGNSMTTFRQLLDNIRDTLNRVCLSILKHFFLNSGSSCVRWFLLAKLWIDLGHLARHQLQSSPHPATHLHSSVTELQWYLQALGKHLFKSHHQNSFGTLSPSLPQSNKHCGYFFLPQAWQTFGSSKSQEMTIQKLAANHPGKHTPTHPPTPQKTHKVQTDGVTFTKNLR